MSKISQVHLLEATPEQRFTFASQFLGLDVTAGEDDNSVMAKIEAAQPGTETIFVMEADPEVIEMIGSAPQPVTQEQQEAAPTGDRMRGTLGHADPRVTIQINTEERNGETYDRDVPVGVNGTVWLIKRGVPATIPLRVYEALKLAVRDNITHNPNTGDETVTQVPSVQMSVLDMPSRAEQEEWRAKTDAAFCP